MAKPVPAQDLAPVNWAGLKPHYEAGIRVLRDLGEEFGVTAGAISQHAKKHEWVRDLKARIQQRAEQKLNKMALNTAANERSAASERVIVESNADAIVKVRMAHRVLFQRARGMAEALMSELESVMHEPEMFAQLREVLLGDDLALLDSDKTLARRIAEIVGEMPQRMRMLKELLEAIRLCVGMEREAYGLDSIDGAGRPMVLIKDFTGKNDPDAPPRPADEEFEDEGDQEARFERRNQPASGRPVRAG